MAITLSRIDLTLPIIAAMYVTEWWGPWLAVLIFIVAAITDYYDGYYARKYNAVSNLGKFMDPVADKILTTSVMVILLLQNVIDPWMVILVVARDNVIGGVRAAAAADQLILDAKPMGKGKAALQMIALPMTMIPDAPFVGDKLRVVGYGLLWVSTALSLWSGYDYVKLFLQTRREKA